MSPQNKRDGRNSHKDRLSCDKKKLNPRLLTMYNIYNQKPPGFIYHSRGPVNLSSKAMMIRWILLLFSILLFLIITCLLYI